MQLDTFRQPQRLSGDVSRILRGVALIVLVLLFAACGGDNDNKVVQDPPLNVTGQYSVSISVTNDDCGFNLPGANTAILVEETGPSAARLMFAGQCVPWVYSRTGDTLRESGARSLQLDLGCPGGDCIVEIDHVTTMKFHDDGSVTGTESNTVKASGGDCSCVILPCTMTLALAGNRCNGCFDCPMTTEAGTEPASLLQQLLIKGGLLTDAGL